MSWRPDGWDETVKKLVTRTGGFFNQDIPVMFEDDKLPVEAGADALLQYLLDCGIISISQLGALNKNGDVERKAE